MIKSFTIQKTKLNVNLNELLSKKFKIKSFPRDYDIQFENKFNYLINLINKKHSIIIIDKNISQKYFKKIKNKKIIIIKSIENNKNFKTVNKVLEFFLKNNVSKSNKIYAIGGGIIQDIAGYACLTYKRGLHWEYVPTTFLGMTDSCVGGKVGINYGDAKNLLALFSAPRKVILNINFLKTLPKPDLLSGLGEALRLHVTGGQYFVDEFKKNIDGALKFNNKDLINIIRNSLLVKKAVVEEDEYEFNIRRSMNFGHSYGHALEILCEHSLAHGTAVSIGMCVESILSLRKFSIDKSVVETIIKLAKKLITKKDFQIIKNIKLNNLNKIMLKDKKTLNGIIKLTVPKKLGKIKFYDQKLNKKNIVELIEANKVFLNYIDDKSYSY